MPTPTLGRAFMIFFTVAWSGNANRIDAETIIESSFMRTGCECTSYFDSRGISQRPHFEGDIFGKIWLGSQKSTTCHEDDHSILRPGMITKTGKLRLVCFRVLITICCVELFILQVVWVSQLSSLLYEIQLNFEVYLNICKVLSIHRRRNFSWRIFWTYFISCS